MKIIRLLLLPFLFPYAAIIYLRNLFFDKKIFKEKEVNAKVISVGNIVFGGSGKTPLVIYLTKLLKSEGINAGVLSRGYRRASKGYLLVSDGKQLKTAVEQCGDEIYHTAEECMVPAAVSENRVKGAERFINDTGVEVIVLDDAFQHRWIKRDINLLIFAQRFLDEGDFFEKSILPLGNMREFFSSVNRADAVVINRKFNPVKPLKKNLKPYFSGRKIFHAHYRAVEFVDVVKKQAYPVEEFKGQRSLALSGIANPVSFFKALEQTNIDIAGRLTFRDHKEYSQKEIQKIRKTFYSTNSYSVVTTEKDAVKLKKFAVETDDIDIFYLKIKLVIDEEEEFKNFIINNIC
jgi:tetraacyldisaccharide 4'-kinase